MSKTLVSDWSVEVYVFGLYLQFLIKTIPVILKKGSRRLEESRPGPLLLIRGPVRPPEATFRLPAFSVFSIQFEEVLEKKKGRFKHEL